MLSVNRTASYEITLVPLYDCLSVCLSVRPSLTFLKIGSLYIILYNILYMIITEYDI